MNEKHGGAPKSWLGVKKEVMSDIPEARIAHAYYENILIDCPHCGEENIFNRASDLKTYDRTGGRDISCQHANCQKLFHMINDSTNCVHEMLISECFSLLERKRYMNCIVNLAQAYEAFFNLFLRVELLYKPFGADHKQTVEEFNRLSEELRVKIKNHSFDQMRALFLHFIIAGHSPKNLTEAAGIIRNLPTKPELPKDTDIQKTSDAKLVPLLMGVKATKTHCLRNKVIHKHAFRPQRDDARKALDEARALTGYLKLYDDITWYRKRENQ